MQSKNPKGTLKNKPDKELSLEDLNNLNDTKPLNNLKEDKELSLEGLDLAQLQADNIKLYRPLSNLRLSGFNIGWSYDPLFNDLFSTTDNYRFFLDDHHHLFFGLDFVDILRYNKLQFALATSTKDAWSFYGKYFNRRYRFPWGLGYAYMQDWVNIFDSSVYTYAHFFNKHVILPLFRKGYWSSDFYLHGAVDVIKLSLPSSMPSREFLSPFNHWAYLLKGKPSWQLRYQRYYRNNLISNRDFILELSAMYNTGLIFEETSLEKFKNSNIIWDVFSSYNTHIIADFYIKPFVQYQMHGMRNSIVFKQPTLQDFIIQQVSSGNIFKQKKIKPPHDAFMTGVTFQKVISTPIYFARFPLSLSRLAPFFKIQYHYYNYYDDSVLKNQWWDKQMLEKKQNREHRISQDDENKIELFNFLLSWRAGAVIEGLWFHNKFFQIEIGMGDRFIIDHIMKGVFDDVFVDLFSKPIGFSFDVNIRASF